MTNGCNEHEPALIGCCDGKIDLPQRAMQAATVAHRLFFYGILQWELAEEPVRALLAGLGPGWPAATRGMLYAVRSARGAYPALLPGGAPKDSWVRGMVHEAGEVDLDALDAFEGAEYRRAEVELEDGGLAEAYLWVGPIEGLEPILHGDFARWLGEQGERPYA